ncbi:hypothetical protein V6Z11_A12G200600 [Gossypium hirsutum]
MVYLTGVVRGVEGNDRGVVAQQRVWGMADSMGD